MTKEKKKKGKRKGENRVAENQGDCATKKTAAPPDTGKKKRKKKKGKKTRRNRRGWAKDQTRLGRGEPQKKEKRFPVPGKKEEETIISRPRPPQRPLLRFLLKGQKGFPGGTERGGGGESVFFGVKHGTRKNLPGKKKKKIDEKKKNGGRSKGGKQKERMIKKICPPLAYTEGKEKGGAGKGEGEQNRAGRRGGRGGTEPAKKPRILQPGQKGKGRSVLRSAG